MIAPAARPVALLPHVPLPRLCRQVCPVKRLIRRCRRRVARRRRRRESRTARRQRLRLRLWTADPHCAYCRRSIKSPERATVDHVIPRSRGGTFARGNAALCCTDCNQCKRDRTPEEWLADLTRAIARLVPHRPAESFFQHATTQ